MSDAYEIKGVTITPTGGGWYELTHSSLAEPEKVQGKENADQRAEAIGGVTDDGSSMQQQPPIEDALATTNLSNVGDPNKGDPSQLNPANDKDAELADLKERLAKLEQAGVTTVLTDGTFPGQIPPGTPNTYRGQMDPKAKAMLKKAGFEVVKIVLEESENIPPTGLFVQHNGRPYMLVPGEEVDVPSFILSVLDDAITSSPIVDGQSQKVLGHRNRSRFPYRRVD